MEDIQKLMVECADLAEALGFHSRDFEIVANANGSIRIVMMKYPNDIWIEHNDLYQGLLELKSKLVGRVQDDIHYSLQHANSRKKFLSEALAKVGAANKET